MITLNPAIEPLHVEGCQHCEDVPDNSNVCIEGATLRIAAGLELSRDRIERFRVKKVMYFKHVRGE